MTSSLVGSEMCIRDSCDLGEDPEERVRGVFVEEHALEGRHRHTKESRGSEVVRRSDRFAEN
eukprot:701473-Prorocentrum_lima.AAC.1